MKSQRRLYKEHIWPLIICGDGNKDQRGSSWMFFLSAVLYGTAGPPSSCGAWTSSHPQVPPRAPCCSSHLSSFLNTEHGHSPWKDKSNRGIKPGVLQDVLCFKSWVFREIIHMAYRTLLQFKEMDIIIALMITHWTHTLNYCFVCHKYNQCADFKK